MAVMEYAAVTCDEAVDPVAGRSDRVTVSRL